MLLERLLENLASNVETFALCRVASGWRLRLPALEWVTLHVVVRGRGEARDPSSAGRALSPGSLLLVPPGLVHSLECGPPPHAEGGAGADGAGGGLREYLAGPVGDAGMLVVCGRVQVLYGGGVGVFDRLRESLVLDFGDEPSVTALFDTMLGEVRSPRPGSRAMLSALMDELLVHVFRRLGVATDEPMPWLDALDAPELRPAVTAMLERPGEPHTVATLAARCHMSRSSFARRFRESLGRPPMEYLRGIRLRHAARLLRQDPPPSVKQVARRVGFGSRSQFSRAFKERFDIAPSGFGQPAGPGPGHR